MPRSRVKWYYITQRRQKLIWTALLVVFCVHLFNPPKNDVSSRNDGASEFLRHNPRWKKEMLVEIGEVPYLREESVRFSPDLKTKEKSMPKSRPEDEPKRKATVRKDSKDHPEKNNRYADKSPSKKRVKSSSTHLRILDGLRSKDDHNFTLGANVPLHTGQVTNENLWEGRKPTFTQEPSLQDSIHELSSPTSSSNGSPNNQDVEDDVDNTTDVKFANMTAPVADWDYFPQIEQQSVKEPDLNLDPKKCATLTLDTSPPPRRQPSQGACDGYAGILHIQQGDWGGASGTIFFQYMVAFLYWADQHNYKPWVHLNSFSSPIYDKVIHGQGPGARFTMMRGMRVEWARDARDPVGYLFPGRPVVPDNKKLTSTEFVFEGTGVWEHYFQPVSDFSPGDPSCENKPLVSLDYLQISQGLHAQCPWASHAWRYAVPDYITQRNLTLREWFAPQRMHSASIVKRYIRFNAEMEQRAACAHPNPENSLGMHIRHGDKWIERQIIPVSDFLPYCEAFVDNGGGSIFLATDSKLVVEEILRDWPERVTSRIVRQQAVEGLSRNESAAFSLGIPAHRTNVEALTDLLALSKCTYLLHGLSALTEAAMSLSPSLVRNAINLESSEDGILYHMSADDFADILRLVNNSDTRSNTSDENDDSWNFIDLGAPVADWEYFPQIEQQSVKEPDLNLDPEKCATLTLDTSPPPRRQPSQGACEGYAGILHIQQGDWGGASGTIFFQYMVAFLYWADQHNYKPWVHLNSFSSPIYDKVIHGQGPGARFTMMDGMRVEWARDARDPVGYLFPGRPVVPDNKKLTFTEFVFEGTGVWEHYFQPVSDFSPGDPSCENKPLVSLDYLQISQGLHAQCPWASHAWRYAVPDYITQRNLTLREWFAPQRMHSASIVKRYIRFNAEMEQRAACAHPNPENSLGMHIRHGDKWIERQIIPVSDFLPYCEAFVDNGGGSIFLATDSKLVVEEILRDWPERVTSRIVRQQAVEGLSRNESAAFSLGIPAHRTNVEALTDLLALSKCTYLLHGLSALTEAAMYMNPALVPNSVNLEDLEDDVDRRLTVEDFTRILTKNFSNSSL